MPESTTLGCEHYSWIGDGYCDDTNNIVECNFDGGDCCQEYPSVGWDNYCNQCQCLTGDTTLQPSTTILSGTTTPSLTTLSGTTVAGKVLTLYFSNFQCQVGSLWAIASSLNIC